MGEVDSLPPGSIPRTSVKVSQRVLAKAIDLIFTILVAAILFYPLGPLLGFLYSVLADGMNFGAFRGQSLGKKICKLKVIDSAGDPAGSSTPGQARAKPPTLKQSALRNAPIGVATFFAIIPIWGWIILVLLGVPLMLIEIYLMGSSETGARWGDVMGETQVVASEE